MCVIWNDWLVILMTVPLQVLSMEYCHWSMTLTGYVLYCYVLVILLLLLKHVLSFVNDNVFRARAIDVITGWLAGLSMVPSGAMDREPRLELSLPVLRLEFNEGV